MFYLFIACLSIIAFLFSAIGLFIIAYSIYTRTGKWNPTMEKIDDFLFSVFNR